MRIRFAAALLWFAAFGATSPANERRITIGPSVPIPADNPNSPHAETFAALNPRNPSNLLATSLVVEGGVRRSVVYTSFDAGKTWRRTLREGRRTILDGGDPIVYFDRAGTAFFGTIQGAPVGFLVTRSTDGGLTWDRPLTIPGGTYDRQYLAFDTTGGKFDGRVYAAGAVSAQEMDGTRHFIISVVYSTDGGRTFEQPKYVDSAGSGYRIFGIADLVVGPNGELVMLIETYNSRPNDMASTRGRLWTVLSADGGASFAPAVPGPEMQRGRGPRQLQTMVARRAAMDLSKGPYRGRIYVTWVEFEDDRYYVKLAHTSDVGKTWSSPVRINDNTGPGDPANPVVAVNQDGAVAVVFNDRRDDPKNDCYRLYVTASLDGGDTFLPNVKVRDGATCPGASANWAPTVQSFLDQPLDLMKEKRRPAVAVSGVAARWPNGGDTQGLVAGPDGAFHAVWINGESGVMQMWHTVFRVEAQPRPASGAPPHADYSRELKLEASQPVLDFEARTLSFTARIENPLPVAVPGPFTVVLDDLQSALKGVRVANADNGLAGKGAAWTFALGGRTQLGPREMSEVKTLRFTFDGGVPDNPGAPLRAHFLILGGRLP